MNQRQCQVPEERIEYSQRSMGQALHAGPSQHHDVASLSTFSAAYPSAHWKFRGGGVSEGLRLTAAMQCNALPQQWATPDRSSRSVSDNVHFHSCSGRLHRPQASGLAPLGSLPESMGSEELAARQQSACHAGPSGRVNSLLTLNSWKWSPRVVHPVCLWAMPPSGLMISYYIVTGGWMKLILCLPEPASMAQQPRGRDGTQRYQPRAPAAEPPGSGQAALCVH